MHLKRYLVLSASFLLWPTYRYDTEALIKFEARENVSNQQQFFLAARAPVACPRTVASGSWDFFVSDSRLVELWE